MSKKRTAPNYPIDELQTEIERIIMSLDEGGVVKFAENPTEFLDPNFNATEVRFLVTQRLATIAAGMFEHVIDTAQRAQRSLADKIVSTLTQNIARISDLSDLREESRRQFVDTVTALGQHAGLKDRNHISNYLSKLNGQLAIKECVAIVEFLGETFKLFPHGITTDSSIAFRRVLNSLFEKDLELTTQEQQTLKETFEAIVEHGTSLDAMRALSGIGKYLRITPETFNENLDLILTSLRGHSEDRKNFHKIVADFSGRIAQVFQEFADDLSPDQIVDRLNKVDDVFTALASDPNPEVRVALVKEIAGTLERLEGFDHNVNRAVAILARDTHPDVIGAFERQVERGYLEPASNETFGR